VDDDGLAGLAGHLELRDEDAALGFPGGEVVVVIKADFARGEDFGVVQQFGEAAGCAFGGLVRVDAGGGVDEVVAFGEFDRADAENAPDPGGAGAFDDGIAVGVELFVVEVAVRIDKHR
jgi:hypothetical protein